MERHCSNALALAEFLRNHKRVKWVVYPGLADSPEKIRIKRYFRYLGGGGVLTFGLSGDVQTARKFVKKLKIASLVVHVGDARTGVLHPATSTHSQMTDVQQIESGVTKDMIRVSVGIEDINDLLADFDQALG